MNKSRKTILVMYRQILSAGGIEKSLFAFFRELKDENIQIRLLLFNYGSDIPEDIYNFVEVCYIDQSLRFPPNKAIGYLIKQKRYLQIILRILITISGHLKIYSFHYFLWRFLDCSISLKYDIAIAYGGVICQNIKICC